jgi:norsolorinic acid ketoreductase
MLLLPMLVCQLPDSPNICETVADLTGVASGLAYMKSVTAEQIHGDFDVNVLGPVVLYQSFADLLAKSAAADDAKFVVISSLIGQVTNALPYPVNAYGISKAAVNFVVKKIDMEDEKVAAFPVQ